VVVASGPLQDGLLPADTTAWIITAGHRFPGVEAPEATSSGAWLVYYDPAGNGGNGDAAWSHDPADAGGGARSAGDVAQARVVPHDLDGVRDE
jgi:hypothetical protein